MESFFKKGISKGGLAGAILGSLISLNTHKPSESIMKKSAKTGFFAAIGFALGALIEKLVIKYNGSSVK